MTARESPVWLREGGLSWQPFTGLWRLLQRGWEPHTTEAHTQDRGCVSCAWKKEKTTTTTTWKWGVVCSELNQDDPSPSHPPSSTPLGDEEMKRLSCVKQEGSRRAKPEAASSLGYWLQFSIARLFCDLFYFFYLCSCVCFLFHLCTTFCYFSPSVVYFIDNHTRALHSFEPVS